MAEKAIVLQTNALSHERKFKWKIENVFKSTKIQYGEIFSSSSKCYIKLRTVIKVVEKSNGIFNIAVGFQRTDRCKRNISIISNLQLCNDNDELYMRRNSKINCNKKGSKNSKERWCISGNFSEVKREVDNERSDPTSSTSDDRNTFYLQNGVLIIKALIKIYGCCVVTKLFEKQNDPKPTKADTDVKLAFEAINDFRSAYETSLYTDFILKADGIRIHAHKFILSARCSYFKDFFLTGNGNDFIEIDGVSKSTLECFVKFLYTGEISCTRLETVRELYSVADKYEAESLKKSCRSMLKTHITKTNACDILKLAHEKKDEDLEKSSIDFIVDNFKETLMLSSFHSLNRNFPSIAYKVLMAKNLK